MGGKSSAPSADTSAYYALASSSEAAAQLDAQTSANELDWAKSEYNDIAPYTKSYLQTMTDATAAETASAKEQQSRLENIYYPMEDTFAQTAKDYNTPARAAQQSAAAQESVSNAYAQQRQSALQNLESYGIDPSQTRYGALDLGTRISQAASSASAATQSRLNTEATGLALQGEAINIGRGYPGSIAQSYQTATQAGASGISAANSTFSTGSSAMGTPVQWAGLQSANLAGASNTLNTAFQNQLSSYNASTAANQSTFGGIGSLVGGLGAASLIAF
jgi:hypothetical protein